MAIVILLIILLILILAVIFAIQNSAVVPISYLIWDTEGSLAFILLLALIFGALIGLLVSLPTFIKNRKRITKQGKDIAALEATIQEQSTKLEMIEGQLTVDEELPATGTRSGARRGRGTSRIRTRRTLLNKLKLKRKVWSCWMIRLLQKLKVRS